jgi:PAS domain-containing protein
MPKAKRPRGNGQRRARRASIARRGYATGAAASAPASLPRDEQRAELILAAVAEGVYEWTIDGNALTVSPRLREILGLREGELTSASWNEKIHPDDRAGYRAAVLAYFKRKTPRLACEYRVRDGKGR